MTTNCLKNRVFQIFITSFLFNLVTANDELIRNTSYGQVRGAFKLSRNGREYYSFSSIPYAQPPVGDLRFAAPVASKPWGTTIYNATQEPPICIQRNYVFSLNPSIEGQEDCLYLNVYVPKISNTTAKHFPVLAYIHHSASIFGSSQSSFVGPQYFMDRDVVVVTMNYRLGPFGFLSTMDDEAPGNLALKDQVLALKWVQDNIGYFGGDKDRVTIMGQSSGGGYVHYHTLSPLSRGLFHQAIIQSGTALDYWSVPYNAMYYNTTLSQAQFVGCSTTNNSAIIECLRNVPAEAIMQSQDDFKTFYGDPFGVFSFVTENRTKRNPNPFITKSSLEYIRAGEVANVSLMIGIVGNEGTARAESRIRPTEIREALNANFSAILQNILLFSVSTDNTTQLYKNIVKKYLGGEEYVNVSNPNSIRGFLDLYSDRFFDYGIYQTITKQPAFSKNVYAYSFNYEGNRTYGDLFAYTNETVDFNWGAAHCDELLYLFNASLYFSSNPRGNDAILTDNMLDLWSNFITYGNPNPSDNLVLESINWPSLEPDYQNNGTLSNNDIRLLNITGTYESGPSFHIAQGFYQDRMNFWEEQNLFEKV